MAHAGCRATKASGGSPAACSILPTNKSVAETCVNCAPSSSSRERRVRGGPGHCQTEMGNSWLWGGREVPVAPDGSMS